MSSITNPIFPGKVGYGKNCGRWNLSWDISISYTGRIQKFITIKTMKSLPLSKIMKITKSIWLYIKKTSDTKNYNCLFCDVIFWSVIRFFFILNTVKYITLNVCYQTSPIRLRIWFLTKLIAEILFQQLQ